MEGHAELLFARQGARTVLARARIDAPMAMIRPFELPGGRLLVQLITLGPGLCAGDAVRIDIAADEGAGVVVTTTAAARIMSMGSEEQGEQHVSLRAGPGALLEYQPCVTIPFPESALTQTVQVEAAASARVGVLETWALGRTARAEYLQFTRISSRTTLCVDGSVRYADAMLLEPAISQLAGAGILSGYRYLASGFWYGATLPAPADAGMSGDEVLLAFGQSSPDVVYLRALGRDGPSLDSALRKAAGCIAESWSLPPVSFERFKS